MKRIFVSAAVVGLVTGISFAVVTGLSGMSATAWGQQRQANSGGPHKIGLIDMAEVFKSYKKFEVLREGLKAEIAQSDQKAKQMAQQIKSLQGQLKQLEDGTSEYSRIEKQLLGLTSDIEAFRKGAQRDFMRKEAQIYKTVYLEVSDAVAKYADYYKYTLIIRFNRRGLESGDKPAEVIQKMNQLVVNHRSEDDITDSVLDYLNRKYESLGSKPNGNTSRN